MRSRGVEPVKKYKLKPEPFAVMDIEATEWTNFLMLGFFDGVEGIIFTDIPKFLDMIFEKYHGYKIFAHYGGKFDFRFLFKYLRKEDGIKWEMIELAGRIASLRVHKGKKWFQFYDSGHLLGSSLKELARAFNVKHQKLTPPDFKSMKDTPEVRRYCLQDCRALYEVIEKFCDWDFVKQTGLKMTLPQQAYYIFRLLLTEKMTGLEPYEEKELRESYHGGRVEVFQTFGKNLNFYDVNSLYPYVMRNFDYPNGIPEIKNEYTTKRLGVWKVLLDVPRVWLPILPRTIENKLCFPSGVFSGWFTTPELEMAKERGAKILKTYKGYVFPYTVRPFNRFIETFYSIKQRSEKGGADYLISKLLMNSLYGKFGMKRERDQIVMTHPNEAFEKGYIPYDDDLDLYLRPTISKAQYVLPHIAAYITSYARLELYRWMEQCGTDLFYCDTDSIITGRELPTGTELGQLKLEGRFERGYFVCPKVYCLINGKHVIKRAKGFDKEYIEGLTPQAFSKAINGDFTAFNQVARIQPAGVRESIRRFKSFLMTIKRKKRIINGYNKRIKVGFNTEPIHLTA